MLTTVVMGRYKLHYDIIDKDLRQLFESVGIHVSRPKKDQKIIGWGPFTLFDGDLTLDFNSIEYPYLMRGILHHFDTLQIDPTLNGKHSHDATELIAEKSGRPSEDIRREIVAEADFMLEGDRANFVYFYNRSGLGQSTRFELQYFLTVGKRIFAHSPVRYEELYSNDYNTFRRRPPVIESIQVYSPEDLANYVKMNGRLPEYGER